MNTLCKNTILIALLAFLFPFALNAQDLIIAGTNDVASMLSTESPKHGGDDPRKKKIKKTPKPVPGCGEVLGYKKNSIDANSIKVEWQHDGSPSKVKYDIRWEETNNTSIRGVQLNITPASSNGIQYYTIAGLKPSTSYNIYINATCDISSNATPIWVVSPRATLVLTTLNSPCTLEAIPVMSSTFYTITAQLPNEPSTSQNTYVFTLRNKLTGAYIFSYGQPATNGTYTFSNVGIQPCTEYIVDMKKQCNYQGTSNGESNTITKTIKTPCCGDISNVTTIPSLSGNIKVDWVNNPASPSEFVLLEVFTAAGAKVSDKQVTGSFQTFTFSGLSAGNYTVKVTPQCLCDTYGAGCQIVGTPIFVSASISDPCAAPNIFGTQSVSSNEVSFQWSQLASTKYRKYKLVLLDATTNAIVQQKEFNTASFAAFTFTHTFTDITENKTYKAQLYTYCCSDACCIADPVSATCNWATVGNPISTIFNTPDAPCNGAANVAIQNIEATKFKVTWQNPDNINRRYKLELWNGVQLLKEEIVLGSTTPLAYTFETLLPNTEYTVKVIAECCFTSVCNWKTGEQITKTVRTQILTPASCATSPTAFTLTPTQTEVVLKWTGGTGDALSALYFTYTYHTHYQYFARH